MCHALSFSPSLNQTHHNCSTLLRTADLRIIRQEQGWRLPELGTLQPACPPPRVCFVSALPQQQRNLPRGTAPLAWPQPHCPSLTGTSGTALTSPPHRCTWCKTPGGKVCRKPLQGGLKERSRSKPLAKSHSPSCWELKCLEHRVGAWEGDSPGPQSQTPRLASPLLEETHPQSQRSC